MSESRPRVSIGIPVFNGGQTLRHTLDALLAQSFGDFEVVISDNASTDDTQEICEAYSAADPRIRYWRNETNLGARANYNRVFELTQGEYFRWNGHDDWIAPTYLERCLEALHRDPAAVACYTAWCRLPDELMPRRVRAAPAVADSESQLARFHDSLWSLPFEPIFGLFRARVLGETDLIPNCPEPDRVTLAQVALLGRFTQVNDVLFFRRRRPPGRKVWHWLDPANRRAPKLRAVRLLRELWRSIDRFSAGGTLRRAAMKADAVLYIILGSVRGKTVQYLRMLKRRLMERRKLSAGQTMTGGEIVHRDS